MFQIFEQARAEKPLLLLDDIFDKLDVSDCALMRMISKNTLGRYFLTDARPDAPKKIWSIWMGKVEVFSL